MARTASRAAQARSEQLVWTRGTASSTLPASNSASIINFTSALDTELGENSRNWTIERIIGNIVLTVPASTAPGRSYFSALAIDLVDREARTVSAFPEPFADSLHYPWIDGRFVYADHTVPASYASPAVNGVIGLDMRSKRKSRSVRTELHLFGYHDNGLSANPVISVAYSALWRLY